MNFPVQTVTVFFIMAVSPQAARERKLGISYLFLQRLAPQAPAATDRSTDSVVVPFLEYHRIGILHFVTFSDWLL